MKFIWDPSTPADASADYGGARVWKRVEAQAKREGLTRNGAVRLALLIWFRS